MYKEGAEQMEMKSGEALQMYEAFHTQMNKVIYGEEHAKDAALAAMVMRRPLIFTGLPGGGKSTLSEIMPYTIDGIRNEEISLISGQHDLTANQLIGGEIRHSKNIESESESRKEETVTTIDGIVQPYTKIVRLEEMNGVNPMALRSLLPVLENRRIENAAGELEMPDLITVVGTMNPTESGQSTFTVSDAMASRFTVGAILGAKGDREQRKHEVKAIRELKKQMREAYGDVPVREMIEPVFTAERLVALGSYALSTPISATMESKIDEVAINTADKLEELEVVHETDRRIGQQIEMNAKVLGGLRNEQHIVNDKDLFDAVRAVLVARLGALRRTDHLNVEAQVSEITRL